MNMEQNQLRIALFEPRIPQNTGNIARTCAAFKLSLDLIKPLGFTLDDKHLKRAGLDYWKYLDVSIFENIDNYLESYPDRRLIGFSKNAETRLSETNFNFNDILLFGREDNGLPSYIREICYEIAMIPMPGGVRIPSSKGVRSLNLSVSCGIVAYHASNKLGYL